MSKSKVTIADEASAAPPPEPEAAAPAPPTEGEGEGEAKPPEKKPSGAEEKGKKKKEKKMDVLSTDKVKFKNVSFDHALTPEEKAERKKAKEREKKGAKRKKKGDEEKSEEAKPAEAKPAEAKPDESKEAGEEAPPQEEKENLEGTFIAEAVLTKRASSVSAAKTKKGKKGKKGSKEKRSKEEEGDEKEEVKKVEEKEGGKKGGKKKKGKKEKSEEKEEVPEAQVEAAEAEEVKEEFKEGEEAEGGGDSEGEDIEGEGGAEEEGAAKGEGVKERKAKKEKEVKKEKEKEEKHKEKEKEKEKDKKAKGKKEKGEKAEGKKKKKEKGKKKKEEEVTKAEGEEEGEAEGEGEEPAEKAKEATAEGEEGKEAKKKKEKKKAKSKVTLAEAPSKEIPGKKKKSAGDVKKTVPSFPKISGSVEKSKLSMKSSVFSYYDESALMVGESSSSEDVQAKESVVEKKEKQKKGKEKKGKKQKGGKEKKSKEKEPEKEAPPPKEEKKEEKKEEEGDKKKKGKKKKGKKEEAPAEEEDDVMAQIMAMKKEADQAAGAAPVEPSEAESKKSKKKKGKKKPAKKLSKKEKAKLTAQQEEEAKKQAEADLKAQQEAERKQQEERKRLAREKDKRDAVEQALRLDQLGTSAAWIKSMMDFNWDLNSKEKADNEWSQYLKCDGLPDPANPAQMNTYLHLWELVVDDVTPDECVRRTDEVLGLLGSLDDFIDDPFDVTDATTENWHWVRGLCRDAQRDNLHMTTYRLLRDVDSNLNRIDVPTADYRIVDPNFTLCLWLMVQLATPMYNPRMAQKQRLNISFPEINMEVLFPAAIEGKKVAVRGIYLKYDHLTDTCATFNEPSVPQDFDTDLLEATSKEWYVMMMYKWTNRKRKHIMIEDEEGNTVEGPLEPEPELQEGELPPTVPFQLLDPSPSALAISIEDEMYTKNQSELCGKIPEDDDKVINLRKSLITGGVFSLNLFYQPPQPYDKVAFDIRLTGLLMPKRLSDVPFSAEYTPPEPEDPDNKKTPEELEEDMKTQEDELDKLLLFTLTLPQHVIFLDLPTLCVWDPDKVAWTTDDIYDVKHIEEKNQVLFRTTRFGSFSFAVNRYMNLPFQAWELRPEADGTVTLQLTCAILVVEFNVKGNTIALTQLQNSPNDALQDIIGTYYKLPKLIRILREGGVDFFPPFDALCYVEGGVCEKHWPLEKHLYLTMGLLSSNFNFTWSRWNVQSGRRNVVMQMREYHHDRPKQQDFHMLLATPLKAVFIDCTEISQSFSEEPVHGMKFCSDLFHLMKATSTMSTKNKVANVPLDLSKTVGDLLKATRILSFS